MIRMLLLMVAVSFLSAGTALADSNAEPREEKAVAEANAPTQAKVRISTRDRWRGRPYLRGVAVENAERDIQLLPIDRPLVNGSFAEGTAELRNEALDKSLHLAVQAGSALPF